MNARKTSLRTKMIVMISAFLLLTNLALGFALTRQARGATKAQINARMLDVANTAAATLDGDVISRLRAEDVGSPEYQAVYDLLAHFRDNIELDYIYCLYANGDGTFCFGIDPDPVAPGEFGEPVAYTDALRTASLGVPAVDETPYEDAWGRFYSAFSPVFDSEGKVAAVVAVDFAADWYDAQLDQSARTIVFACVLYLILGVGIIVIMTGQYSRQMDAIQSSLRDLAEDMEALTSELGEVGAPEKIPEGEGGIQALGKHIADLRDRLRDYITQEKTQANSMITAMASDYRCVYHVDLDRDDAVCYQDDPDDPDQMPVGVHFPYYQRILWYADSFVAEPYREGFRQFVEPDSLRARLATEPIIAYRYQVKRGGREYYEMIRAAGVRRAKERGDHTVHAIGLGLTVIDAEMRESMARNAALAEALTLAEEANKAKTAFLSNMSHEIRTPMNAIIGLDALALHDEGLSPQTRDYLEKIGGSAHHLLALINDILDMSRIESGQLALRKEEFSFTAVLEQINTMVMSQCAEKGLHYECRVLSAVDDCYIGDDMKLKEVLVNILSNAIKFTNAPGSVTMTVERVAVFDEQSTLRFKIKDTGIGMDKAFIPRIFDAFAQEDSGTKSKYGSTGLGMAITKNIVEMMNGTISVESEKGVGTEFTVAVTLRNSGRRDAAEQTIDPAALRILIVDDDPIAAGHAQTLLGEAGIRADACHGGKDALHMLEVRHLKQEPYNLVLMDWKMPEMDGVEATRRIRERYSSETSVVLLTAYNWDEIMDEALRAGVDGFLAKPLTVSNILGEFERIARRSNLSLFREKPRAELAGRRVLLAEDTEINAEIMMDILEMEEMEADHAENGRICVDMFQSSAVGTYSAILMDVRMPEMDGLEAASTIRALDRPDAKTIPIIALTANAFDEDVQRSLQAGMNAHLSKPVESDHLFRTLAELIYESEHP